MVEHAWIKPTTGKKTQPLKLYNTLTRSKVDFIPQLQGNLLRWYSCGPTVYDASHMGHARNYVTIDIVRRILQDYFGFQIQFIMNITDIDDKIIVRGRQEYLLEKFKGELNLDLINIETLSESSWQLLISYWRHYVIKTDKQFQGSSSELDFTSLFESVASWMSPGKLEDPKLALRWKNIQAGHAFLLQNYFQKQQSTSYPFTIDAIMAVFSDVVGPALDEKFGASVTDPVIYRKLAEFWEIAFFEDMDRLGVQRPSVLTRVSEYIPEIIQCVEEIMKNGYGYERNGSVYFDTRAFDGHHGHQYAKLCPNAADRTALIEEAEGVLSLANVSEKKNPADFALWKRSKAGEPEWSSPWGLGRPGWAIECSAMAGSVAPGVLDLHSGGIDLAFPHHDNELAQSEAQFDIPQWVNYFLHTGHLHIAGQKMSKSLKNFITIREALQTYTARQLRLFCLYHPWHATLDFKEASMQEIVQIERTLSVYFDDIKAIIRENRTYFDNSVGVHYYNIPERQLRDKFDSAVWQIDEALRDSFDTPTVIRTIMDTLSRVRLYLKTKQDLALQKTDILDHASIPHIGLLEEITVYVTKILAIFGIEMNTRGFGFRSAESHQDIGDGLDVAEVLAKFRHQVRSLAMESVKCDKIEGLEKSKPEKNNLALALLKLCDRVRDQDLLALNYLLEDLESGNSRVKKIDSSVAVLLQKENVVDDSEPSTNEMHLLRQDRLKKQQELAQIPPKLLFKRSSEYSQWDDQGVPTHDDSGQELTKSRRKKLQKEMEMHKKLVEKFSAINLQDSA